MPALGTILSTTSVPTSTEFDDHSARHENGGADEITVAGLSGTLADPQTAAAHAASHQDGGADEISIAGLAGTPLDLTAHLGDTADAHDASAVSVVPFGTIAATDVQAALEEIVAEAGGAPADATYLVATAHAGLSAEVAVGATPGGELGGTWASPTVDATHSGSAHHDPVTVGTGLDVTGQLVELDLSEVAAGGELGGFMDAPTVDATHSGSTHAAATDTHIADTTDAHDASAISILDAGGDFTATDVEGALDELQADNEAHAAAADPHTGYVREADASWVDLTDGGATTLHSHAGGGYTDEEAQDAVGGILVDSTSVDFTYSDATPSITAAVITGTTAAAIGTSAGGSAATPSKSDHVHATGAGTPSTQAFGDAAATGTGPAAAMTDHLHGMPADPGGGSLGAGFFGDGSDGALSLTRASAAPAYASKSGSGATTLFTLTRDVYATTFDLDDSGGSFLVRTNGFRIFANVSLTIDAGVVVHSDGNAASGATAGALANTGTIVNSLGAGSAGAVNTTATQASASTSSIATTNTAATAHGGTGGAATGGGTGGGVAGGNASLPLTHGSPRNLIQALQLMRAGAATFFAGGAGGTGGNATGGSTATGGGGGAGGAIVAIYAKLLTNNGVIRSQGGAGGNAAIGNGTGAGGGAGGGGGAIVLVYGTGSTTGTLTVTGGTGGTLAGTGATGGTGVSGLTYLLAL